MKDNDKDSLRSPCPPVTGAGGDAVGLFGKGKYKAWALAAILLLAFWSMLTGTVTLNFSSHRHGLLLSPDDLVETPLREDLDVLVVYSVLTQSQYHTSLISSVFHVHLRLTLA